MKLVEYLPYRYRTIEYLTAILNAEDPEAEAWRRAVRDLLMQANINTATWGLDLYEERYGLPVAPPGRTLEERRAVIRAKRRAFGVIDEEVIEQICEDYVAGKAKCTSNAGEMTITLQFLGEMGTPGNIAPLLAFLRSIIAAYTGIITRAAVMQHTLGVCGVMGSILTTPVREAEDKFDFVGTLYMGGAVSTITASPIQERPDPLDLRAELRMGSGWGTITKTPIKAI